MMEQAKDTLNLEDYSVTQTSLEQVCAYTTGIGAVK